MSIERKIINSFDIDGVIHFDKIKGGIRPRKQDIIITGRSIEESKSTLKFLKKNKIKNKVYFNFLPFDEKTRKTSAEHKAMVLNCLYALGIHVRVHFEDDEVQKGIIEKLVTYKPFDIVHIVSNLTNKENIRR